jgi:phage baseplate assembly protein W
MAAPTSNVTTSTPPATRALIGWPLLPLPDANGQLQWPDLTRSVRDAIRIILSTRPAEQLMRPEFGGGLDRLLHEPNTVATRRQMRDLVQESLERWEPRILLDGVEVWEVDGQPSHVRVEIAYRLARTGAAGAMNVTIQLET